MRDFRKVCLSLICAAALASLSVAPIWARGGGGASTEDPLLDTLNNEFRMEYQTALAATLAGTGPVILEEGDDLILVHQGERTKVQVKPVEYHELKSVAHVPLALYVMLAFPAETPLSAGRRQHLQRYRELMLSASETLPQRHFTADQLARQKEIFGVSFKFLDGVLARDGVGATDLEVYTRRMAPLLLANVADATALEMRGLYATAAAWKKQLTPEEWKALHVVMIGPHMPREQECSIQFFERLLGEPMEGERIVYAEALWNEKDALNLLATHVVDESAGAAFFGDPMRMHRDLLADAAKAYLDAHPMTP